MCIRDSTDPADTLIVTSIQKMSNIKDEAGGLKASDIEYINGKRIVDVYKRQKGT